MMHWDRGQLLPRWECTDIGSDGAQGGRASGQNIWLWQTQLAVPGGGVAVLDLQGAFKVLLIVEWKQRCRRDLWSATVNNMVNNLWVTTSLNCCVVWREQCSANCAYHWYNWHNNIRDKSSRKSRTFYEIILFDT